MIESVCRRVCLVASFSAMLSACAINPSLADRKDVIAKAPVEQAPLVHPTKSASAMREALACMDRMLAVEQVPSTLIAIKFIPDPSGLFQTSTKDMIITALSRMSRTSGAFRVVDYEIDALKQDTVQTLTSLLLNNSQIELRKPQIYVSGAISFGDKTVVAKRSNIGISTKNTDAGFGWDVMGTMVALDLHLGDMNSRTLYPGIDSANELVVASGGKSIELGGRASGLPRHIYEMGAQLERSADNNQGAGAAIRLLVDLAAIELVGKWARVPYWTCVDYEQNHPEFKRQMRAWYEGIGVTERLALAQRVLAAQAGWSGPVDGRDSPELRHAIATYQSAMDLTPVGTVTFETYASLMGAFAGMTAEDRLWAAGGSTAQPMAARPNALPPNTPEAGAIQMALLGHRNGKLKLGESVVLRVTPARTGHLYCYYADAAGTVSQIYPNPLQPLAAVQGNMPVTIPDPLQPGAFLIEAAKAGAESALCAVSRVPLQGSVPDALLRADLSPIAGQGDMAALGGVLRATGQLVALQSLQWEVEPGAMPLPGVAAAPAARRR